MRVAFSGSSGTGKTTTAQALRSHRRLSNTPFINTDARAILAFLKLYNIQDLRNRDYITFQLIYLKRKLQMERSIDAFLTERSSIDCLAYWNLNCRSSCDGTSNSLYERLCVMNAKRYDQIFYFPWGLIPFHDDGWRGSDPMFHSLVDREARKLYDQHAIQIHVLTSIDVEGRCSEIIEELPHE